MNNYETIVQLIERSHPKRARSVAARAFRSDQPLRALARRVQLNCCNFAAALG